MRKIYNEPEELNKFGFYDYGDRDFNNNKDDIQGDVFWLNYENNHQYDPFNTTYIDFDEKHQKMLKYLRKSINKLTIKQRVVLKLLFKGLTQTEMANILGITQSAVALTLNGCKGGWQKGKDYSDNTYGGIYKKLKKLVEDEINSENNKR